MRIVILLALLSLAECISAGDDLVSNSPRMFVETFAADDGSIEYRIQGRVFTEESLAGFLREQQQEWPAKKTEVRIVLSGESPLNWIFYVRRLFRLLGYSRVRCFVGGDNSDFAFELSETGHLINVNEVER